MLGLATIALGIGSLVGFKYGGAFGSIAGALVGGSLVNSYRALYYYKEGTDEGDKEAGVAATYAALTTALAGYLVIKHVKPHTGDDDETTTLVANPDEDLPLVEPSGPCALRPVGPRVVPTAEVLEAGELEEQS